jgi:hypothetical protein
MSAAPTPAVPSSCSTATNNVYVYVTTTYNQPLYVPLIGNLFSTGANNTRVLTANAQALCEQ